MAPPQHSSEKSEGASRTVAGRNAQQVGGAHPGGEQALVRVPHGGVGEQDALLRLDPGGQSRRALLLEDLPRPGWGGPGGKVRDARGGELHRAPPHLAGDGGVSVDDDVRQVVEELGGPVAPRRELEQRGRLVDEAGVRLAVEEDFRLQDVFQEVEVGLHAADAELAQRPLPLADGTSEGGRVGDELSPAASRRRRR